MPGRCGLSCTSTHRLMILVFVTPCINRRLRTSLCRYAATPRLLPGLLLFHRFLRWKIPIFQPPWKISLSLAQVGVQNGPIGARDKLGGFTCREFVSGASGTACSTASRAGIDRLTHCQCRRKPQIHLLELLLPAHLAHPPALILSLSAVLFGADRLDSTERMSTVGEGQEHVTHATA
jgi:hypothetical protein